MAEKIIAGLSCFEVLADLSSFIEGSLSAERTAALRAHVAECSECERCGRDFQTTIEALRSAGEPSTLPADVGHRLSEALRSIQGE